MIKISLTDFVDYVGKTGTSRISHIRELKKRPEYDPRTDYYKTVREAIREAHESNSGHINVAQILSRVANQSKRKNYETVLLGHQKYVGRKTIDFFDPPHGDWRHAGLSVRINPEVGLEIDGVRYVVKLYLKADKLSRPKAQLVTHAMSVSLKKDAPRNTVMSVLDTRQGKLYAGVASVAGVDALLSVEAMGFVQLWDQL